MSQLQKIEYFCLVKEIMWEKIISYDGIMHFFFLDLPWRLSSVNLSTLCGGLNRVGEKNEGKAPISDTF
jgi:hypothetical protein